MTLNFQDGKNAPIAIIHIWVPFYISTICTMMVVTMMVVVWRLQLYTTTTGRLCCNHSKQFLLVIRVRRGKRMNRPLLMFKRLHCWVICSCSTMLFPFSEYLSHFSIILIVIKTNDRERGT